MLPYDNLSISMRSKCPNIINYSISKHTFRTDSPHSHAGHAPYLYQGALSIVSQTLLLMGATMSPSLSNILLSLVPNMDTVDQIIAGVVQELERYAILAPSLALASDIIAEAEGRRRRYFGG